MPSSNHVDTPGLRVHYLQEGTGEEAVVLLHGFPETSHQWRHQLAALADAGYACFAPDNRGFGATDKPDVRISRGLLARDVVRFMDAVGLASAHLVTHDWGGIIGFKVVADYPERVRSIALADTLCTVWAPRARHGWWFKAPGLAETFFAEHHRTFIECFFGGRDGADLPGPPASPWPVPTGSRPRPDWVDADTLDHYVAALADPATWAAAIQYYRYGLPFHLVEEAGDEGGSERFTALGEAEVAAMWLHPDGLAEHPNYPLPHDFGPEDRTTCFEGPALWLPGGYLGVKANASPAAQAFVGQFERYFPNLQTQPVDAGHFVGEEAPAQVNAALLGFLGAQR